MNTKFVRALLFIILSLSCTPLIAHDDSDDHSDDHHRRPRAADLADCCTPGDADFPNLSVVEKDAHPNPAHHEQASDLAGRASGTPGSSMEEVDFHQQEEDR